MSTHQADVFAYRFDWDNESNILFFDFGEIIGAAHGVEIASVFNQPNWILAPLIRPFAYGAGNKEEREVLASSLSSYWVNFATTGIPGTGVDNSLTEWRAWDSSVGAEKMMLFDVDYSANEMFTMSTDFITKATFVQRLQDEAGFTTVDQKCKVYLSEVGVDDYYQMLCSH